MMEQQILNSDDENNDTIKNDFHTEQIKTKLDLINTWLENPENSWFNSDFIKSLEKQFNKKKRLSGKQLSALDKIVNRCVNRPTRPHWK